MADKKGETRINEYNLGDGMGLWLDRQGMTCQLTTGDVIVWLKRGQLRRLFVRLKGLYKD